MADLSQYRVPTIPGWVQGDADLNQGPFLPGWYAPTLPDLNPSGNYTAAPAPDPVPQYQLPEEAVELNALGRILRTGAEFGIDAVDFTEDLGTNIKGRAMQGAGGVMQSVGELSAYGRLLRPQTLFEMAGVIEDDYLPRAWEIDLAKRGADLGGRGAVISDVIRSKHADSFARTLTLDVTGALAESSPALVAGALTRSPWIGLAAFTPQVWGSLYNSERLAGSNPLEAAATARFKTGTEVGSELIPLSFALAKGKPFLSRVIDTSLGEGAQEAFNEFVNAGYDKGVFNGDTPLTTALADWLFSSETYRDAAYSGLVGSIAGGTMGAAVHPLVEGVRDFPAKYLQRKGEASTTKEASKAVGYEMLQQMKVTDLLPVEAAEMGRRMNMMPWDVVPGDETSRMPGEQGPPVPPGFEEGYVDTLAAYAMETGEQMAPAQELNLSPAESRAMADMGPIMPLLPAIDQMKSADPVMLNVASVRMTGQPVAVADDVMAAMQQASADMSAPIRMKPKGRVGGYIYTVIDQSSDDSRTGKTVIAYDELEYGDPDTFTPTEVATFPTEFAARTFIRLMEARSEQREQDYRDRAAETDRIRGAASIYIGGRPGRVLYMSHPVSPEDVAGNLMIEAFLDQERHNMGRDINAAIETASRRAPASMRNRVNEILADWAKQPKHATFGSQRVESDAFEPAFAKTLPARRMGDYASESPLGKQSVQSLVDMTATMEPGAYELKAIPEEDEARMILMTRPAKILLTKIDAREPTPAQHKAINGALNRIVQQGGYPVHLLDDLTFVVNSTHFYNAEEAGFMTLWPTIATVGVRDDVMEHYLANPDDVEMQHAFDSAMAHELSHFLEMGKVGLTQTSMIPGFEFIPSQITIDPVNHVIETPKGSLGDIVREALQAYFKNTALRNHLSYPLGKFLRIAQTSDSSQARWMQAELFAQIGAMYYTTPQQLKRNMPLAFALMEDINGKANLQAGRSPGESVRGPVQSAGAHGGLSDLPGYSIKAGEGALERGARPGDRERGLGRADGLISYGMAPHGEGRRVVKKKFKREKKSGRYVGAPDWVANSPQKLGAMYRMLKRLALEGEAGRYWYEQSSRAILNLFGGNVNKAEKLVALIAIYSPNATVPANTTMALTAYYQWEAGVPINAGFNTADEKAQRLMDKGEYWQGIKTNSFYQNLMIEIDPSKLDKGAATMDMWMAIAGNYGMKVLDQGPKYEFMETMINNIAAELGWDPHQVQAAIWTAMKGRVDPIRPLLQEQELKKGIGEFVEKTDPKTGKTKQFYNILDRKAHYKLAHKLGMAYDLKQEDIEASKYDFSDALKASSIMLSWEATPGKSTGVLPGIHNATTAQKMEYLRAIQDVLAPGGVDQIAEMVGIAPGETLFGFSAWEGDIGAGAQTLTSAPMGDVPTGGKPKTLRGVKPVARDLLNLYSGLKANLLDQEAVVWHTPVFDKVRSRHNGALLDYGRPLSEQEMGDLYQALHDEFGTWDLAPGYTATGVRILNFTELDNIEFHDRLETVLQKLGFEGHQGEFRSDGAYIAGDYSDPNSVAWTVDPYGKNPQAGTLASQSPDIQGRYADLRAGVQAVNQDFIDRYGWDDEGQPQEDLTSFDMTAWHGSPHIFTAFSLDKVGTGEGAQAYGWGIYLAESKGVGINYQKSLGDLLVEFKGKRLSDLGNEELAFALLEMYVSTEFYGNKFDVAKSDALANLHRKLKSDRQDLEDLTEDEKSLGIDADYKERIEKYKQAISAIDGAEDGDIGSSTSGNLYEVDLSDEVIAKMLDWDAVLDDQPQSVIDALEKSKFWKYAQEQLEDRGAVAGENPTGKSLYRWLTEDYSPEEASMMLNELGIPGIKYWDGGSRKKGDGTRNYVVFDPSNLTILSRNGEPVDLPSMKMEAGDTYVAGTDLGPFVDRLNSEDDAKQLLIDVVRAHEQPMFNARRGKMTVEEIRERAGQLGWTERDMNKIPRGSGVSPEEFEAGRAITDAALTRLKELAELARDGSDADVLAFEDALKRFTPLAETMLGMRAEWGRVGVMMQQQASQQREIDQILSAVGGRAVVTGQAAVLADQIARGASDAEVAAAARRLAETRRIDQILEFWYASLLSGLRTHAVNSTSNALVALWTLPETFVAAGIGKMHSGDKVFLREVTARAVGMMNGIRDGAQLANEIIREDMPMGGWIARNLEHVLGVPSELIERNKEVLLAELGQKMEGQPRVKHIPGKAGEWIRSPLTMLSVEDALFQLTGQRMELYAQATRQAIKEGSGNVNQRAQAIVDAVDALIGIARPQVRDMTAEEKILWQIYDDAWAAGKYQTFTNDLGPAGLYAQRGLNRFPVPAKFVMPFVRTPTNIVKFFGHRTPLALVMPSFWEMYNRGGAYRDIAIARVLFGSAIMATIFTLALAGRITGGGPSDDERNERRIWRQKYTPYSLKYGDKYYAYNRLEPIGMLFGVAADMAYLWNRAPDSEKDDLFQLVHASILRNLMSKTWLTGLSEAVNVIYEPTRYGERVFGRLLSTSVPTIVSHVAGLNDPYLRQTDTMLDYFRARVPGLRDDLEVRHNIWGQPITYGGILGPDLISFIYMGTDPNDPVVDELLRLEHYPGMPGKKIRGVELTPSQYNEYVRIRGVPAKQLLDAAVATPEWKQTSDWRRIKMINDIFRLTTDAAMDEMAARHPEIPTEAEAKIERNTGRVEQDLEMQGFTVR